MHSPTANQTLIVIPCLNEEQHIGSLLQSLITNQRNEIPRIVVVDGGSTDRTTQITQEFATKHSEILLLHNPKRIQAAAINLAVATYGSDATYLIRIDAHAEYPENYCQSLINDAKATNADSVVVAMRTVGNTLFQSAVAAAQNSKLGNGGSAHRNAGENGRFVDHGHHALMRLSAFRTVGGYDENFACNEDAELDYRFKQAGFKIWLTQKTYITYFPRATPISLLKQYIGYGHGRAQNIKKHSIIPKVRQMLPACAVPIIIFALLSLWHFIAALPFILWATLCLTYGCILAYAAKEPSIALAGPAAMIMHAGWSWGFWSEILFGKRVNHE